MGKQVDISKLNDDQLVKLQKEIENTLSSRAEDNKKKALDAAKAEARKHGFNLQDLLDNPKAKSKPALPPKYRHPENPEVTWSGRGRRPDWVREALDKGQSLDEFAI